MYVCLFVCKCCMCVLYMCLCVPNSLIVCSRFFVDVGVCVPVR